MIVRCIANTGEALPVMSRDRSSGFNADTEFSLTINRSYAVFAITVFLGIAWYYVFDDDGHTSPRRMPAPMFEVMDGSFPKSWQYGYFNFSRDNQYPIISFPEWAQDHLFFERLVDGDTSAVGTFDERRREIEVPESS